MEKKANLPQFVVISLLIVLFTFTWVKFTELNASNFFADPFTVEEDLKETHRLFINGSSGFYLIHAINYQDASYLFASAGGNYYYIVLDQNGQLHQCLKVDSQEWSLQSSFFFPCDHSMYLVLNPRAEVPPYKGLSLMFVPVDADSKELVMDEVVEFPDFQDSVEHFSIKDNAVYLSGFSFVAKFSASDGSIMADYYSSLSRIPLDIEITATSVDEEGNIYFIARFSGIHEEDRRTPYLHGYWCGKIDHQKEIKFLRRIPDISISVPPPDKIACVNDTLYLFGSQSIFILNKEGETKKTLVYPMDMSFSKSFSINEAIYLYGRRGLDYDANYMVVAKLLEDNVIVNPSQLCLSEVSFFPDYLSQEGNTVYAYGLSEDKHIGISKLNLTGKEKSFDLFKRLAIQDKEAIKLKGVISPQEIRYNEVDLFKLKVVSKDISNVSKLQKEWFKVSDATGLLLIETP